MDKTNVNEERGKRASLWLLRFNMQAGTEIKHVANYPFNTWRF